MAHPRCTRLAEVMLCNRETLSHAVNCYGTDLVQPLPPVFAIHTSPPPYLHKPKVMPKVLAVPDTNRYSFAPRTSTGVSSHASVHVGMLVPACNEDGKCAC